jgi:hypothetical protein
MAWYHVFNYENDADRYMRMEAEKNRRYSSRVAASKSSMFKPDLSIKRTEPMPKPEPYQYKAEEYDYNTVEKQYAYNRTTIFKDLKEPDFNKTVKEKTLKPPKIFGTLLFNIGAKPLARPKKVYKFKTIDSSSGAEVITQQKEIEVCGENESNYYYLTKNGLQSVAKQEVSDSPIDSNTLRLKFMQQINEQAKSMARHMNDGEIKQREVPLTEKAGGFLEETKDTAKSFMGGVGYQLSTPLRAAADFLTNKESPQNLRTALQTVLYELDPTKQIVSDPLKKPWGGLEKNKGYIHDPEYYKEMKLELKDGKLTEESKQKLADFNKMADEMEKHPWPKGYSKETDAMAAGASKAEIAAAREEDKKDTIKALMGKSKDYEMDLKENVAMTLGELTGIVLEFIVLDKVGAMAAGVSKSKIAAHIIKNLITGGSFGILETLKKRDAKAKDYIRNAAKEAAFFIAGEGAVKGIEKGIGPTRTLLGTLGKKATRGLGFGTAGAAAALPFMTKEERTPENIAMMIATGIGFEVGGEVISRSARKLKPKFSAKPATAFEKKFNLDASLRGISTKTRKGMAFNTTRKLLDEIGAKIKAKIGSSDSRKIIEYYSTKYNLAPADVKITVDKTLRGESKFARVEFKKEDGIVKEIEVRVNSSKSENEIIAGLRHEIEHVIDKQKGYKKPMRDVIIEKPETLREYMEKGGHHKEYKNFEIDYLENIYNSEVKEKAVDTARKIQLREKIKNTTGKKQQELVKEFKMIKQRERERMGLDVIPEGSSLANEKLQARNRQITEASNLPIYIKPREATKSKIKNMWNKFYTHVFNRQHAIDKTGKKVKMTSQNYVKHHATSNYINTENLVTRTGEKLGNKSLKDVLVAPKGFQAEYESYLFHKHHIGRMKNKKPVLFKTNADGKKEAISIAEAKEIIKMYEKQFPQFKKHAEDLYQFIDDFMREWAVDGGLLTEREYQKIRYLYPDYVPTFRDFESMGLDTRTKIIKVKPLKEAVGGDDPLLPIMESLPFQIQKIVRAERRNQIGQELITAILYDKKAMQPFAQVVNTEKLGKHKAELLSKINEFSNKEFSIGELSKKFDEMLITGDKIKGNYMIVMEGGKPITLKINDKNLWNALANIQNANTANKVELTKILNKHVTNKFKSVVTVYNPFFAVRNIARDIPTAYIQGSVSNPFTFGANIINAFKSRLIKDDLYQKFKALGGTSSNITDVEHVLQGRKNVTKKVLDLLFKFLNFFGDVSETVPRLAEFKHVYKKSLRSGMAEAQAAKEALYMSSEVTINFSRGGDVTKSLDAIFPYINAGTQGVDKWVRSLFIEGIGKGNFKPVAKALGVTTVPTVVFYFLNNYLWDKDAYNDIPDYAKDTYYLVPVDDNHYFRIPKTRENGFIFSTLFERLERHFIQKDPDAFKGLGETFVKTYLDPITQVSKGGFPGPLITITSGNNKDYFGRDIEPLSAVLSKKSKRYITKENTSKASKALAPLLEKIGFSPAQADYLIQSYGGVIADFVLAVNDSEDSWINKAMRTTHWFHDTRYGGKAQSKIYEDKDEAARAVSDFEEEHNLVELKQNLRAEGKATKFINMEIRKQLGAVLWKQYQELKDKRKELNSSD